MENIIPIIVLIGLFILVLCIYLTVKHGLSYIYSKIKQLTSPTPDNSAPKPDQVAPAAQPPNPPDTKAGVYRAIMGFFDIPPWVAGGAGEVVFLSGIFTAAIFTVALIQGCQLNLFVLVLVALPWAGLILAWKRPGIGGLLLISTTIAAFIFGSAGLLSEKSPDGVGLSSVATVIALGSLLFIPISLILFYLKWDRRKKQKNK